MKDIILLIVGLFTLSVTLFAQDVPRVISYQGVLVGVDGKPVNSTPQNPVKIKFELVNAVGSQIKDLGTESNATVVGGLFTKPLDLDGIQQNELNQQLFLRITVNDGTPYPLVPLYSSVSALNIPDNVVTSTKIKDGEVKAIDIGDNEVVKSIKGLKEAIDIVAGNPNIRIKVDGQNILVEGKDTVKAAEQLIGGIPSGVPVGTVLPYMGDGSDLTALEADGWYLCDGRLISDLSGLTADKKNTLQQLFSRAGNPSPGNLPDLRGYFLRGADRGQGKDLDFDVRLGTGNRIGSLQEDAVQQHRHFGFDAQRAGCGDPYVDAFSNDESKFASSYNDYFTCAQVYCNILATKTGTGTPKEPTVAPTSFQTKSSKSSTETRPKNVYVNYIIKAR